MHDSTFPPVYAGWAPLRWRTAGRAVQWCWSSSRVRASQKAKDLLRWPLLSAMRCRVMSEWFDWLESTHIRSIALRHPCLVFKPLQAYLSTRFDYGRRARIIRDSWRFAMDRSPILRRSAQSPHGVTLARFDLCGHADGSLRLGVNRALRREGEFVLSLRQARRRLPVMSLAFSLEDQGSDRWRCYVGCVQGAADDLATVKTVTKTLHGLRPKMFVICAMQMLAAALPLHELYGAGQEIHVYRAKHLVHLTRWHRPTFNYDQLWEEAGGERDAEGWYQLGIGIFPRAPDTIKANKRRQYQRRYTLLDSIRAQIGTNLINSHGHGDNRMGHRTASIHAQ